MATTWAAWKSLSTIQKEIAILKVVFNTAINEWSWSGFDNPCNPIKLGKSTAIGGDNVGEAIQGRERYPINVRYPREVRDSLQRLRELPFVTEKGAQLLLQDVAKVSIEEGPPMLRSENARLSGWVYVDVRGRDLRSVVNDMQAAVAQSVNMPAGYAVSWYDSSSISSEPHSGSSWSFPLP